MASKAAEAYRPGIRRRNTGPPTREEQELAASSDEWELGTFKDRAEEAVSILTDAVTGAGADEADLELEQQLSQLNLPAQSAQSALRLDNAKPKSNLHSPYPPNLPLALLRLMDAFALGLAEVPTSRGGWDVAKRDQAMAVVKDLGMRLGEAERLSASKLNSSLPLCGFGLMVSRSPSITPISSFIPSSPHLSRLLALFPSLRCLRLVRHFRDRHCGLVSAWP